jgi:NADH:flavin oxidoreductase / NADH oxidase family
MSTGLFAPFQPGDLTLANRLVMAPMTRNRAGEDGVVPPMMAAHYRDRAGAGLIITESTPVSPQAIGYPFTPGSTPARRPRPESGPAGLRPGLAERAARVSRWPARACGTGQAQSRWRA